MCVSGEVAIGSDITIFR